MNEKHLWELWAKCKHPHPDYGGGYMVWPMEFAELIIQECMKLNSKELSITAIERLLPLYKEHFGVEV